MNGRPTACLLAPVPLRDRVAVVIATRNRPAPLHRTLAALAALPDPPAIVVVDDASAQRPRPADPRVEVLVRPRREGPVARNHGVRRATTPYVALNDDDSWWAPGALERAAAVLDAHPRLAVVAARILVGDEQRPDPICDEMANSPLAARAGPGPGPGPPVASFMAGAAVVRREAFLAAGGFEPRLEGGGEEEALACDLMVAGWELAYVAEVVAHHHPAGGDKGRDRVLGIRNALWFAWRRRPLRPALRWTAHLVVSTRLGPVARRACVAACRGLPWVLRTRRVVPPEVESRLRALDGPKMRSEARRYG
jgi:GT2 family glycosyltransferase